MENYQYSFFVLILYVDLRVLDQNLFDAVNITANLYQNRHRYGHLLMPVHEHIQARWSKMASRQESMVALINTIQILILIQIVAQ